MTFSTVLLAAAFAADPNPPSEKFHDPVIEAELGQGITIHGKDDFTFQIRGRMQQRLTVSQEGEEDVDALFQVRRLRLVFLVDHEKYNLQAYIQLGLAPLDMEPDLLIPLRDAVLTWSPIRDVNLRVGQMKVPFSRERVISSSALQFADRSINNAELTLDRDMGMQVFSNNLFGLGHRLTYNIGLFNGDGRNRVVGAGLLAVARVEVRPFGKFDDAYVQADVDRNPKPRLVIAGSVARNTGSNRARSTSGDTFVAGTFDYNHAEADVMFKAGGFSFLGEGMVRMADKGTVTANIDGEDVTDTSASALGWSAATGYVFPNNVEPSVRVAEVRPFGDLETSVTFEREVRACLSVYVVKHNLKLQTDYGYLTGDDIDGAKHEVRMQGQVFF